MLHQSRYSLKKKIKCAQQLKDFVGDEFQNPTFAMWLGAELGLNDLHNFLKFSSAKSTTGRPPVITKDTKTVVQTFWNHSIISVDRRNLRNSVNISKKKVSKVAVDVTEEDILVTVASTKRGFKYKADRYISTKSYLLLYKKFCDTHNIKISYGNFVQLKPFYITPPTSREKESCLCITFLNAHRLYDEIKRGLKVEEFPTSLTSYFTSTIECEHDSSLQFPQLECLTGDCINKCKLNLNEHSENSIVSICF